MSGMDMARLSLSMATPTLFRLMQMIGLSIPLGE
jgi:hypothetical protein